MRSPVKQKILLLLASGLILSFARSPGKQRHILKQISKEWRAINRQYLYQILQEFRHDRLVDFKEKADGTIQVVLTEAGKKRSLVFNYDRLLIKKPSIWKGAWQLVLYDIPESKKRAREEFRRKIRELGFYEWQKSAWIFPYPCRDEIDFAVEFLEIRPYVRYAELKSPTNEAELKLRFNIPI